MAHKVGTPGVISVGSQFLQHVGDVKTGPIAKDGDRAAELVHESGTMLARREVLFEDDPFLGRQEAGELVTGSGSLRRLVSAR